MHSPLYLLERFDVGIVRLDAARHVLDMNQFARRVLPVDEMQPFSKMVLDFHPERSKPKVEFLLDQAAVCPVASPPPMTMIINIPERVLLIKVSRMSDMHGQHHRLHPGLLRHHRSGGGRHAGRRTARRTPPPAQDPHGAGPADPLRRCRAGAAPALRRPLHPHRAGRGRALLQPQHRRPGKPARPRAVHARAPQPHPEPARRAGAGAAGRPPGGAPAGR